MRAIAGQSALLVVDLVNPMEFPGADRLLRQALPMLPTLARLKRRLKARGVPTIYVNDNFTHWLSDFRELVAICSQPESPGAEMVQAVPPEHDDYLVLKPKHSAFFATPLEVLLAQLGVRHVVVSGIAGDGCVLATAADAHMREFEVSVPPDCCASITRARNDRARRVLGESMHLDTGAARHL